MPRQLVGSPVSAPGTAAAILGTPHVADAAAQTSIVTGEGWVALLIIAGFVALIYLLIRGTLQIENRDGRFYGGRSNDDGWFGIFPYRSDDDGHGHHHHDGGEGAGG